MRIHQTLQAELASARPQLGVFRLVRRDGGRAQRARYGGGVKVDDGVHFVLVRYRCRWVVAAVECRWGMGGVGVLVDGGCCVRASDDGIDDDGCIDRGGHGVVELLSFGCHYRNRCVRAPGSLLTRSFFFLFQTSR